MKNWSDDAFAGYLAAMIDGEGHIEKTGTWAVRVRIANTVRPTLAAMADRLGFGRVIECVLFPLLSVGISRAISQ